MPYWKSVCKNCCECYKNLERLQASKTQNSCCLLSHISFLQWTNRFLLLPSRVSPFCLQTYTSWALSKVSFPMSRLLYSSVDCNDRHHTNCKSLPKDLDFPDLQRLGRKFQYSNEPKRHLHTHMLPPWYRLNAVPSQFLKRIWGSRTLLRLPRLHGVLRLSKSADNTSVGEYHPPTSL
jgi:hypothetical protein